MPFSLSLFLSSISLWSMCMLIWSSLCFVNHHRILNSWAQLWHSCIYFCCTGLKHICSVLLAESRQVQFLFQLEASLQTHHVDSTLKRRGNDRFHVVSTWNPRGVFVGKHGTRTPCNDCLKNILFHCMHQLLMYRLKILTHVYMKL